MKAFRTIEEYPPVAYVLPNGRRVTVAYDVCRMAATLDHQLSDGRIVLAVIDRGNHK